MTNDKIYKLKKFPYYMEEIYKDNHEGWINTWRNEMPSKGIAKGLIHPNHPEHTSASWIYGNKIQIYSLGHVSKKAVEAIRSGSSQMIDTFNLNFEVTSSDIPREVESLARAYSRGGIDEEGLSLALGKRNIKRFANGKQFPAEIILIPGYFNTDRASYGSSRFHNGNIIFALPKKRQNDLSFLEKVAAHETAHLIGYGTHHSDTDISGFDDQEKECIMDWEVPSDYLCGKCFTAIDSFWKGLEELTQRNYRKNNS